MPSSPIPSQDRRFSSRRLRRVAKWESPLSVIPQQKLKLIDCRCTSPLAMLLSALSVIFWQSCKHKVVKFLLPRAELAFSPARCAMPVSEMCRQLRRFKYFNFGKPQAHKRSPVFVMLQHPARSSTSKLLKNRAIRPRLVSVICLHKLRFNTVKDERSLTKACPIPMSVTLKHPLRFKLSIFGRFCIT